VALLGGVGAAAREMKISQPAMSQRLRKLERQVGRKLYGTAGRKLVLTEEGRALFESCRQAFDALEAIANSHSNDDAPLVGRVRIVSLSEVGKTFLLPEVQAFRTLHPGVGFDILYQRPYDLLFTLSRQEADFGLTNAIYHRPQIEMTHAFTESIVCVGPAPARKLSWSDLGGLCWISYGVDDSLWLELERLARRHAVRLPRPSLRVADVESILSLAAKGAGYALAPAHALFRRGLKGLAVHEVPFPTIRKEVCLCRLQTLPLGRATNAFWNHFHERCKTFSPK
jgi:DNA-binding transcriptional LysR family regulator